VYTAQNPPARRREWVGGGARAGFYTARGIRIDGAGGRWPLAAWR